MSTVPAITLNNGDADVFGFELAGKDLSELAGLDSGTRLGPDPDTFG